MDNLFKLRLDKAIENIRERGFDEFFDEIEKGIYQCKFIRDLQIREDKKGLHVLIPTCRRTAGVYPTESNWKDAIKGELKVPLEVKESVAEEFYGFDAEKIPDTVFADECDEFTVDDVINFFPVEYSFEFEEDTNAFLEITNDELLQGSTLASLLWGAFDGLEIGENDVVVLMVPAECKPLEDVQIVVPKSSPVVFMDKYSGKCRVDNLKAAIHIGKLLKAQKTPFSNEFGLTQQTHKGWNLKLSDGRFDKIIYPYI